jgi:hypothetical protein
MLKSSMLTNAAKTSFRRVNPRTGCLSRERFSPVLITKNNESQLKYWLLIRYDAYHRNWVVQLEIRTPEGHAITERTLSQRDCNLPKSVIEKLGQLYTLMASAGAKNLDRLLQGKVSFSLIKLLPIQQLKEAGFIIGSLPEPIDPAVYCTDEYIAKARISGLAIDGSNLICSDYFGGDGVAAFKSLVLELDRQCITWHVYLDHTLRDWFYLTHNYAGLDLIKWLYAERRYCVTTSQKGVTADELLLFWAKRNGHHIISRDTYSDQDTSWLREAAAANYPRLHKFYTDGYSVSIPTLRIEAVYRQLNVA